MIVKLVIVVMLMTGIQYVSHASDPTRPDIPTQSPQANKALVTQLNLTMIQHAESGARAVINGQSLTVGDFIGGYQMISIGSNHVMLKNNKGQVRLSLIARGAVKKS